MLPYRWRRRAVGTVALAAVVGMLAVALAALIDWVRNFQPGHGAEPPKVTDWLQAWGSVAGVIAALLAAAAATALLVHERHQSEVARRDAAQARSDAEQDREEAARDRAALAEERRDAAKAQARMVVLAIRSKEWGGGSSNNGAGQVESGATLHRFSGLLRNFSTAPIFDVVVEVAARTKPHSELPAAVWSSPAVGPDPDGAREVVVGATVLHSPALAGVGYLGKTEEEAEANVCFVVRFTDAAGRRWERRDYDQPVPVYDASALGKAPQPRRSDGRPGAANDAVVP